MRAYSLDGRMNQLGVLPVAAHPSTAQVADTNVVPITNRRGRPPKFGRAARAVTLTLPVDVIAALARLHVDLSRAVVKLVERRKLSGTNPLPVEVTQFGSRAVIVVQPVAPLKRIEGIELVPLP